MTKITIFTKEDLKRLSNDEILVNGQNKNVLYMSEDRYQQYLNDRKNIIKNK